jgi:hypothetical protein
MILLQTIPKQPCLELIKERGINGLGVEVCGENQERNCL